MKKRKVNSSSIRLNDVENFEVTEIEMTDEMAKSIGIDKDIPKENYLSFLRDSIGKNSFRKLEIQFDKYVNDTIPKKVKEKCKYCGINGDKTQNNRICRGFIFEGRINFFIAGIEFYRIYNINKELFKDKKQIRYLCYVFFSCFKFCKGHVYFDSKNLYKVCLKEGLKSISVLLENSDRFNRNSIINHSLHTLQNQQILYKIDYNHKNEFIQFQISHYKEARRFYKDRDKNNESNKSKTSLHNIWLANAKITTKDFLQKGIDAGIWNEQYEIITKQGSIYGSGKALLSNLAHALKGYSISDETDYKVIGQAFCEQFNIEIKKSIKEPYKSFNKENRKIKSELKRVFSIK